ncbi:MgtC/SapB family protein [Hyphobacterium marinum]|uniref:Protein MgtC n=1 Tax=Hyphobacterium marinum TaxID=3116574 RepID=A0ABU7LZC0_9PROT|nr:MgtC/SapB family protein [Hyphobacterium sp. Y6023]MEE2566870.1 MgtC/SapB family protein [Hyphobacterium sp. Y6023]
MDAVADIFSTHTPYPAVLSRLAAAAVFGMAIGIDRELNRHRAGLRTHMLICVAAALFTIMAIELAYLSTETGEAAQADLLRIIEAVTAGVAFLGAGAIIQARGAVHGMTTAAGMWLAGAIGVAAGAGFYGIGLAATLIGVLILTALGLLQKRIGKEESQSRA